MQQRKSYSVSNQNSFISPLQPNPSDIETSKAIPQLHPDKKGTVTQSRSTSETFLNVCFFFEKNTKTSEVCVAFLMIVQHIQLSSKITYI